ncbi:MAG: MerR family transcriptional regulator [Deltaproteobacteria bacterium]|nr:MerR family transcriptional regulator [Deltaproteobacteria bacterium]
MDVQIPAKLYFRIGEVSKITKVQPYVLRYWEAEFNIVKPHKSVSNQRVYTRRDVELILEIKRLLYKERYTLDGAKRKVREIVKEMKNRQMALELASKDEKRYFKTIEAVKRELMAIKEMLG